MARKASLEQRAFAVISTSGGLITLILALAALLLGKDTSDTLGRLPQNLLVGAVGTFVAAAVIALFANIPKAYLTFTDADLDRMVREWEFNKAEAEWLVASLQVETIKVASNLNNQKGRLVQAAVAFAVLGVTLVAGAVVAALTE